MQTPRLKIGTRGSKLALWQAHETRRLLSLAHGIELDAIEIVVISTTGDRECDRPLSEIGGKGLFTREIEVALLAGDIHLAVHSMKDMPTRLPGGLVIGACLEREDVRDAFLSHKVKSISELPQGATVGTSSVRRAAQLKHLRPDIKILPFRGNVETRLKKLDDGLVDATFLACAGLKRLGYADRIASCVAVAEMMPAVAQGAIGIEIREGDERSRALVAAINHRPTETTVACERAFLTVLDGSCRTPIAGHAVVNGSGLTFAGEALTLDGVHVFRAARAGAAADAAKLGSDAGEEVKASGGALLTH